MIIPRSEKYITFEKINLNHTLLFFKDIKNIDVTLLNVHKTCAKNTNAVIYEIKYTMVQRVHNKNINKEVPLCLSFSDVDAYIFDENQNKYLVSALRDSNKIFYSHTKNFGVKVKSKVRQ